MASKARTLQQQLEEDYTTAPEAAKSLGLDKSHLCEQARSGKFPGAFLWGPPGSRIWIIPRAAVESYRGTHLRQSSRPVLEQQGE